MRNLESYNAIIENNTLNNIADIDQFDNPDTGALRGLLEPLVFQAGVNGEFNIDSQLPIVTFSIDATNISEDGGITTATLIRNTDPVGDLSIALLNSNPDVVTVPTSVTIPDGETSTSFEIVAIDNDTPQGTETSIISVTTPNLIVNNTFIDVIDDEVPSGITNYIEGTDGNDAILLGYRDNDLVTGLDGNDLIQGGNGDDILRGDGYSRHPTENNSLAPGDDTIFGGAGNDQIGGKGGNDQLFGEDGDDLLWGDAGDDLLQGGSGNDTLTGDNFSGDMGNDTFVLTSDEGSDTITDYSNGGVTDTIQVLDLIEVTTVQSGSDTLIISDDELLATLTDFLGEVVFV
ncbi:MAG: calcium-binding protein [Leptolyngbya sp. SIO3F4]|nr:calcium-binding protein [Leptolyngbya sp. SIO3F4]